MIDIRHGTRDDIDMAAHIICSAWKIAYTGIVPEEDMKKYSDESFKAESIRKYYSEGMRFFVASSDGKDCGICSYMKYDKDDFEDCAYIVQLYIHPDFQRTGAGSALVKRTCEELKLLGYKRVVLNTLEKNSNARAFYERQGFVFYGTENSPIFSERVVRALYKKEL